jgi:hypothetical protein
MIDTGADQMSAKRITLAYIFGFAGTLPFLWGAITQFAHLPVPEHLAGAQLQITYGIIIFAYMCGTHWNFAAQTQTGENPLSYIYAVTPTLLLFAVMTFAPQLSHLSLIIGFPMLLLVDHYFANLSVTPIWWMNLRLWLTTIVFFSLLITYI